MVSGVSAAVGITWKVVIAAEVLAMPIYSVGTKMQNARINLETAEVFAWTFVSIVLSGNERMGSRGNRAPYEKIRTGLSMSGITVRGFARLRGKNAFFPDSDFDMPEKEITVSSVPPAAGNDDPQHPER
jgi:hypothetical protein